MSEIYSHILFGLILLSGLVALAVIDIRSLRLPNVLTFPLMGLGLLQAHLLTPLSLKSSLIGLAAGYLGFVLIEKLFRHVYKKDGLGRGDAKLLAVGGAWCGWFSLPHIVLIASLCGLAFTQLPSQKIKMSEGQLKIPFGPFLSFGIMSIWIVQYYYLWR